MSLTAHLFETLREASAGLPAVTEKRMFGCDALFASGKIFGLIWKDGRIGLKLSDPAEYQSLMSQSGSDPWKPGGMKTGMGGWVLVPESLHDDVDELRGWAKKAHAGAMKAAAEEAAKPAKKSAPKQKTPALKKAAPGKTAVKARPAPKKAMAPKGSARSR